jgi:hypothetical protein
VTEQPTTPVPPVPPMPRLGRGVLWSDVVTEIERDHRARTRDAEPAPEPDEPNSQSGSNLEKLGDRVPMPPVADVIAFPLGSGILGLEGGPPRTPPYPCSYTPVSGPPSPEEVREIADELNAHGGLDEVFVAELLRQAADPYADAKRGLGMVDTPPPVTTTEPITYETIVEALEKIAPLGPLSLDTVKLTQEQVDVFLDAFPDTRYAAPSAGPWHYFGTPVEIVETIEESTPYQLTAKPGGIIEIDTNLTDAEFARLRNDWLHAVERGPQTITRVVPFGKPFRPLADVLDEQPTPALRPWWRRALDRVRRWTR